MYAHLDEEVGRDPHFLSLGCALLCADDALAGEVGLVADEDNEDIIATLGADLVDLEEEGRGEGVGGRSLCGWGGACRPLGVAAW